MTLPKVLERPKPSTTSGNGNKLMRHIVALNPETGEPSDTCLCGHVWDKVFLAHGDEICQVCVELSKKVPRRP